MLFNYKFVTQLSDKQKSALKELKGEGHTARTATRAEAILLSERGYTIDQIAGIVDCHRITVSRWIVNWEERGIDGILEREGRGRKRTLTEAEEAQVMGWLKEDPRSIKKLLIRIDEVFGKKVSHDTIKRLVKRNGKVWKRMRAGLTDKRDEESFRQCKQELMEHVEAAAEGRIDLYFFDEAGFGRTPCIPYAWQDRGFTMELMDRDDGGRLNVIGNFHFNENSLWTEIHEKTVTKELILKVLEGLSEGAKRPRVVFIDNASIHTANVIKDKLAAWEEKGLYLYFIPAYSPELNYIEMIWRKIKYEWLPLDAYKSFDSLKKSLEDIFSGFGKEYNFIFA